ncbi:hypothetical protein DRQ09_01845 [candidate division KSB1 bacterium]|mgnify:CR=1 FL=1|nr:MAG: hypothetical protein DRQ09_01845 [candidate division KSB1 bacterium]
MLLLSKRKILFIAGLLILLLLSCSRKKNDPGSNPSSMQSMNRVSAGEAVPVKVESVKMEDISSYIMTTTTLEAEKKVDIIARVSGMVNKIYVEEGDYVKKGKVLAELDKRELLIAVKEAEAKVNNTKAILDRSEKMFKDNLLSKEELENKKYQYELALSELDRAKLNYNYASIRAPFTGVITKRQIFLGNMVNVNQVLFTIADFRPLLARIYVPEKEISKLKVKQKAKLTVEMMKNKEFWGEIKMISPVVDPQSGTIKVTIEINDEKNVLRPGMFASVYIITETHKKAKVIPKKALLLETAEDVVFKFDNGIARKVSIKKGFEDGERIEVLDGLDFGDRVIVVGQEGLRDGAEVRIPGEELASQKKPDDAKKGAITPEGKNPRQFSDDQVDVYLGMMLNNPEIKKEYDKRIKKDPALKTDTTKKIAFIKEMGRKFRGKMR